MAIPPSWLEDFVQQLSLCLLPHGAPAPLGCHYFFEAGCWEIAIFPSMRTQKKRNSSASSDMQPSPFSFDIQQAISLFEEIHHLDWITIPATNENEVGPHLLIEAIAEGFPMMIRICAEVPQQFQHDRDLIIQEQE